MWRFFPVRFRHLLQRHLTKNITHLLNQCVSHVYKLELLLVFDVCEDGRLAVLRTERRMPSGDVEELPGGRTIIQPDRVSEFRLVI